MKLYDGLIYNFMSGGGGGGGGSSDPYAGYDVVVKSNYLPGLDLMTSADLSLEKGDWASISTKIDSELPIRCMVYGVDDQNDRKVMRVFPISGVYGDVGYNDVLQIYITDGFGNLMSGVITISESGLTYEYVGE